MESYYLTNESNFMNEKNVDPDLVFQLNKELEEDEVNTLKIVELDPDTKPYKMALLNAFRDIEDPFGIEVQGQTGGATFDLDNADAGDDGSFFDYCPNPADPSRP